MHGGKTAHRAVTVKVMSMRLPSLRGLQSVVFSDSAHKNSPVICRFPTARKATTASSSLRSPSVVHEKIEGIDARYFRYLKSRGLGSDAGSAISSKLRAKANVSIEPRRLLTSSAGGPSPSPFVSRITHIVQARS